MTIHSPFIERVVYVNVGLGSSDDSKDTGGTEGGGGCVCQGGLPILSTSPTRHHRKKERMIPVPFSQTFNNKTFSTRE